MDRNTKAIEEGSQRQAVESSRSMTEQEGGARKRSDEDEGIRVWVLNYELLLIYVLILVHFIQY